MLSAEELAEYQEFCEFILVHKYTRKAKTAGSDDTWNMAASADGTTTVDVACNYVSSGQTVEKPNGTVLRFDEPSLTIAASDTLAINDEVINIKDSSGTVLLAGPVYVKTIESAIGFGPTTLKIVTLQGTKPIKW